MHLNSLIMNLVVEQKDIKSLNWDSDIQNDVDINSRKTNMT